MIHHINPLPELSQARQGREGERAMFRDQNGIGEANAHVHPTFAEILSSFTAIPRRVSIALDKREARDNYIAERAEELMSDGGPYCPWDADAMREAMAEAFDADMAELRARLKSGQFDAAGRLVLHMIVDYWKPLAAKRARESIDANWSVESGWTAPLEG